ncbi:MAG TPA: hypothetical protein VJV79_23900 [Polyangiaceae bacterium]|nr:hypothetical protein [Polyangiaceae bacterium]
MPQGEAGGVADSRAVHEQTPRGVLSRFRLRLAALLRWHAGTLARWHAGSLARWHAGTLVR